MGGGCLYARKRNSESPCSYVCIRVCKCSHVMVEHKIGQYSVIRKTIQTVLFLLVVNYL